jgi:hypothetical protein
MSIMEDKYLESILDEIKESIEFGMMRYSLTKNSGLLDIMIGEIDKYIKMMEESDKKSKSINEFIASLRGMRNELIDEKGRNIRNNYIVRGNCSQ